MAVRLRDLEAVLQQMEPFDKSLQKIDLEQYSTSPHIASRIIYTCATSYDDIDGKMVVDLGTGTAMLGIGCAVMGATHVIGFDADLDALNIAQRNIEVADVGEIMDLVMTDVSRLPVRRCQRVDTIIMNPPFGTRNKGVDVLFLEKALELQPRAIYSLHKSSTRKFLINKAKQEWGLDAKVLAELKFDIPQVHKFHKKKAVDVDVDFIRFEVPDSVRDKYANLNTLPPPPPPSLPETSIPTNPNAASEPEGVVDDEVGGQN
mmetsp:Transcript_54395/g.69921  ORF Transcript_54395/g.69921 Transcript_54395/m.69921 type:complete len:261 (-) Transcript_54395:190-972(-)